MSYVQVPSDFLFLSAMACCIRVRVQNKTVVQSNDTIYKNKESCAPPLAACVCAKKGKSDVYHLISAISFNIAVRTGTVRQIPPDDEAAGGMRGGRPRRRPGQPALAPVPGLALERELVLGQPEPALEPGLVAGVDARG